MTGDDAEIMTIGVGSSSGGGESRLRCGKRLIDAGSG